jgi:hypothetical protein
MIAQFFLVLAHPSDEQVGVGRQRPPAHGEGTDVPETYRSAFVAIAATGMRVGDYLRRMTAWRQRCTYRVAVRGDGCELSVGPARIGDGLDDRVAAQRLTAMHEDRLRCDA